MRASAACKAIVFSATTFAGSAQFAATSVLSAGGTLAAAIAAAVLLNTRYVPIGLSVAPSLRGPAWKRGLRAQLVVDESWAVSHLGGGRYDARLLLGAGLTLYCAWVGGTTLGSVAGLAARRPRGARPRRRLPGPLPGAAGGPGARARRGARGRWAGPWWPQRS